MEMVLGLIRHILTFGGGLLSAKGYIAETDVELITGAVITLVGTAWSAYDKKKNKTLGDR